MIFLANLTRVLLLGIGLMVAGCGLKFSDDEAAKTSVEPNKVTLSTKLVETGDLAKPYAVQVDVATKEYADLYLVKTNDLAALIAQGQKLSKTVGAQSAAEVTNLAAIDKTQFSFTDQNVNPRSKIYYAVVQIVGEAVPAPDQLSGKAGMPAPVGVEIPALTVAVAVSQQIDSDQILANKVFFAPSADNQRLLKQENGVITQTITIPAGDLEYIDNTVSFEKNYRYTLEVLDSSGAVQAVHDSNTVTYNWPVLDLSSEAVMRLAVDEKTALHNYEYVFEDLTKFKPILQLQSSVDGVSFSDATVLTDVASERKWVALKTAPERLKFRVQQLNRSGLPISTSPVKELVIPKDLQVTGAVTAAAIATNNKIENIGRLHLANATITLGSSPLEITATKLISDASKFVAFSATAAYNTVAANAGALKINAQTATGTLEVDLRGQQGFSGLKGLKGTKGATGSTGASGIAPTQTSYWNKGACDVENPNICPCDKAGSTNASSASFYPTNAGYVPTSGGPGGTGGQGSPGYSGEAGGNSGASGSLTFEVQTDELTKIFNVTARTGGNGGEGGDGGDGGNGGAGGNPGPYWCTDGKGTKSFSWPYYWPASRNPPFAGSTGSVGAVGPKGVQGPNGQPGTAGQICEKIGTQPQRCY